MIFLLQSVDFIKRVSNIRSEPLGTLMRTSVNLWNVQVTDNDNHVPQKFPGIINILGCVESSKIYF